MIETIGEIIGVLLFFGGVMLFLASIVATITPSILQRRGRSVTLNRLQIFVAGVAASFLTAVLGLVVIGLSVPADSPVTNSHAAAAAASESQVATASNEDAPKAAFAAAVPVVAETSVSAETAASAPVKSEYDVECKVVGVSDGDTITCLENGHDQIKVRLNQIDAPEKAQDFGNASKKALSALVFGKVVGLKTNGKDKYKRTLAEVFIDGKNVNKEMVRTGYAWAYKEYLTDNEYSELERLAQSNSLGLWSMPDPIYPSDFRHGKRKEAKPKAAPVAPNLGVGKPSKGFTCSGKRFCREMNSCEEAQFYLNKCGVRRLDGDNDGIPCESLC